jgi:excisionase family DNA binding protein
MSRSKRKTALKTIEPNRIYSRTEAAEVLNVSLSTVKRMIADGRLQASQPYDMRRVFILGASIRDLVETDKLDIQPVPSLDDPEHHTNRAPIQPNRVYSRNEAAIVLNVSLSTVKRLINSNQLRFSQPPGMRRVFITGQALFDFLEETRLQQDDNSEDEKV